MNPLPDRPLATVMTYHLTRGIWNNLAPGAGVVALVYRDVEGAVDEAVGAAVSLAVKKIVMRRTRKTTPYGPPPEFVTRAMALLVAEGRSRAPISEIHRALLAIGAPGSMRGRDAIRYALTAAGYALVTPRLWSTTRPGGDGES